MASGNGGSAPLKGWKVRGLGAKVGFEDLRWFGGCKGLYFKSCDELSAWALPVFEALVGKSYGLVTSPVDLVGAWAQILEFQLSSSTAGPQKVRTF